MKNKLRTFAKEKRKNIASGFLNEKIINNLINFELYKNAKNVLCYYSKGDEISTVKLFGDKSKNWYLPRVNGDDLLICPYEENNLSLNKYKILEPCNSPIRDLSIIDFIIVPAICADKYGYRLGYGKGYYDRFLKKVNHNVVKVILAYSELLFDTVFPEKFDVKCDYTVTENSIIKSC